MDAGGPAQDIQEITWATLTGGDQEHLVVVYAPFGSSGANSVAIYAKSPTGKIIDEGGADGVGLSLDNGFGGLIQDVDGDGKDELVVPTSFAFLPTNGVAAIWPRVFKLQNGKYVEASRDFAKFYDTKILPELNIDIADAREDAASEARVTPPGTPLAQRPARIRLDTSIMARDKILRVIGRDPKAGEQQARDWVYGPDPDPWFAGFVFHDLGGHEKDREAARREMHRENEAARARVRGEAASNNQH
jgi:hypothetical protein